VSLILNGVVANLANDTLGRRRFVWDEMAFLQLWWDNQATPKQQELFTKFVKEGRIELAGNGCVRLLHSALATSTPHPNSSFFTRASFSNACQHTILPSVLLNAAAYCAQSLHSSCLSDSLHRVASLSCVLLMHGRPRVLQVVSARHGLHDVRFDDLKLG
jgi:hypothetical protein